MRIYINDMICPGCRLFVESELERLGLQYKTKEQGEVEISDNIADKQLKKLKATLQTYGLFIIYDNKSNIVKKIKLTLGDLLHYSNSELRLILPHYIDQKNHHNYFYLDDLFKDEMGISIEEYFNSKKIEHAKKLLVFYNLTLNEVVYQLNYDSIEEFVEEFKNNTGLTPLQYKELKQKKNLMEKSIKD